jgi:hypothetical protein
VLRLGSSEQGVTEIMAVAEHVNSMAVTASFSVLEKLTGATTACAPMAVAMNARSAYCTSYFNVWYVARWGSTTAACSSWERPSCTMHRSTLWRTG